MRAAAVVLLVLLGGGGLYGGFSYVAAPDGSRMGTDASMLPSWLPGDYLLPGIVLLIAFGLAPLLATALVLRGDPRAWPAVIAVGLALVLWMTLQIGIIGLALPPMQLGMLALGAALTWIGEVGLSRRRREADQAAS
ncbi:hypothetical protein [Demequina salsinemoris]|uniref:hypothetical protein n=1 Tax=Demequina salsinemoris TaxID=577470 RepID=UPI0007808255|nr:hypothetical protein [Demequina salsinemoris]